jgi:5-methylcytosine-specific restriction protein A
LLDDYLDGYQRGILEFYRQNPHMQYPKDSSGKHLCRWCMGSVKPPKRTFCSPECVHEYKLRSDWTYCKRFVAKRDKFICQICRIDCKALKKCLKELPRGTMLKEAARLGISQHRLFGKVLYDIDHIVPVVEGGGMTGPDGLRLLCIPCHLVETRRLRQRMKKK